MANIRYEIDFSEVIEEFNLIESMASEMSLFVTTNLVKDYLRILRATAQSSLKSTRLEYLNSISSNNVDSVTVEGDLAVAIEEGADPYDLKTGNFKKHPTKDGGWYVNIPFRHASPRSKFQGAGFSSQIPPEVYKVLKGNIKSGDPSGRVKDAQLPSPHDQLKTRYSLISKTGNYPSYQHQSPIYENLVQNKVKGKNQFSTIRRISNNSDPMSWIHPGFIAKDLMGKALTIMNPDMRVEGYIDVFLNSKNLL